MRTTISYKKDLLQYVSERRPQDFVDDNTILKSHELWNVLVQFKQQTFNLLKHLNTSSSKVGQVTLEAPLQCHVNTCSDLILEIIVDFYKYVYYITSLGGMCVMSMGICAYAFVLLMPSLPVVLGVSSCFPRYSLQRNREITSRTKKIIPDKAYYVLKSF